MAGAATSIRTNLPVYDSLDLKDRILKIRENISVVKQEKDNLQTLIQAKEKHLVQLRQDYNILAPEEELRWAEVEDQSGSGGGGGSVASSATQQQPAASSLDQKRFQIMNDKLEMQLLIQEIRQALPPLEAEVKFWESTAKNQQKKLPKSTTLKSAVSTSKDQTSGTAALLKSMNELEEHNQVLLDHILKMKTEKTHATQKESEKNQQFFQEIASLRKLHHSLSSEKQSLVILTQKLRMQHRVEEKRYEILCQEYSTCREKLKSFHNGYGWQYEIFKNEAGSVDKKVPVQRIPTFVSPWIKPLKSPFVSSRKDKELTLDMVKKVLLDIFEEELSRAFNRVGISNNNSKAKLHEDHQTLTAASSNLSDDSFFRRNSVIAEHQLQMEKEKQQEREAMEAHKEEEEEEEELLILPKASEKSITFQPSKDSLQISQSSLTSVRSQAESLVQEATDIDFKTFCLLCDRLLILLEA